MYVHLSLKLNWFLVIGTVKTSKRMVLKAWNSHQTS